MSAAVTVTTRQGRDGGIEITAVGELDLSTVRHFQAALENAINQAGPGRTTAVDLRGVDYLDSAAINVLFANADKINRIRVRPLLLRGLTISGLDQMVEISADGPR